MLYGGGSEQRLHRWADPDHDEHGAFGMAKLRTILNWRLCEAATLLVLASLMTVPAAAQKASDGFRFEQPEFLRTEFVVKVVEYQTAEAVAQAALEAGAD